MGEGEKGWPISVLWNRVLSTAIYNTYRPSTFTFSVYTQHIMQKEKQRRKEVISIVYAKRHFFFLALSLNAYTYDIKMLIISFFLLLLSFLLIICLCWPKTAQMCCANRKERWYKGFCIVHKYWCERKSVASLNGLIPTFVLFFLRFQKRIPAWLAEMHEKYPCCMASCNQMRFTWAARVKQSIETVLPNFPLNSKYLCTFCSTNINNNSIYPKPAVTFIQSPALHD